jgi:hydroxypyruvate isomerase
VEIAGPETASAHEIAAAAATAGVEVVLCNAPVADLLSGGPGLSGVPGRQGQFHEAIRSVGRFARAIGCSSVNVGPSRVEEGMERQACLGVLADNLRFAGDVLGDLGVRALVEPLNWYDVDRVLLRNVDETMSVFEMCAHPNVFLQFDAYHMYQMHADPLHVLESAGSVVGHVQFADVPGRGAPGTGQIDFEAFFTTLDRLDYRGWAGAEYRTPYGTAGTLAWLARYRGQTHQGS